VSRTTQGADGSEGFTDYRVDGRFREVLSPVPGALHHGIEFLVGVGLQHPIDAPNTSTGGEQKGQEFLGDLLLFAVRKFQDLLLEGLHPGPCRREPALAAHATGSSHGATPGASTCGRHGIEKRSNLRPTATSNKYDKYPT